MTLENVGNKAREISATAREASAWLGDRLEELAGGRPVWYVWKTERDPYGQVGTGAYAGPRGEEIFRAKLRKEGYVRVMDALPKNRKSLQDLENGLILKVTDGKNRTRHTFNGVLVDEICRVSYLPVGPDNLLDSLLYHKVYNDANGEPLPGVSFELYVKRSRVPIDNMTSYLAQTAAGQIRAGVFGDEQRALKEALYGLRQS